ncbi:hypothetical protein [Burkholderia glumae]|nr:hypothetical protein [Burkholderia glumae]
MPACKVPVRGKTAAFARSSEPVLRKPAAEPTLMRNREWYRREACRFLALPRRIPAFRKCMYSAPAKIAPKYLMKPV